MAGPAPEELTTESEQTLWVYINHAFDAHCGTDPDQFDQKEREFVKVLNATLNRLYENRPALKR